jgi:hypothetical protein
MLDVNISFTWFDDGIPVSMKVIGWMIGLSSMTGCCDSGSHRLM